MVGSGILGNQPTKKRQLSVLPSVLARDEPRLSIALRIVKTKTPDPFVSAVVAIKPAKSMQHKWPRQCVRGMFPIRQLSY